jgi:ADP-heptose:LPS heptosyltransferase
MAWTLRKEEIDLAIDLQGDVRSNLLMYLTGAARRVGYANTGGAALLTDVVALDETVSWVEQNRRALATALPTESSVLPASPWRDLPSRAEVDQVQRGLGLAAHHPLVGIHPSGGRQIKQWDIARWREITRRLQERFGATVIVTGIGADRALADALALDLPRPIVDTTGRLSLLQAVALIRGLDLFLSPDTGTMHIACSVGTPSVTLFGPSDPVRYFSGAHDPARHTVIASTLWCAPCNLIRKPPRECREREMPECLASLSIDTVYSHIEERLRTLGFNPAPSP